MYSLQVDTLTDMATGAYDQAKARIRAELATREMSITDLAKMINVPAHTAARLLRSKVRGGTNLSFEAAENIRAALAMPQGWPWGSKVAETMTPYNHDASGVLTHLPQGGATFREVPKHILLVGTEAIEIAEGDYSMSPGTVPGDLVLYLATSAIRHDLSYVVKLNGHVPNVTVRSLVIDHQGRLVLRQNQEEQDVSASDAVNVGLVIAVYRTDPAGVQRLAFNPNGLNLLTVGPLR